MERALLHALDSTGIVAYNSIGAPVPAIPTTPVYSSAVLAWRGFLLERHRMPPVTAPASVSSTHILGVPLRRTPPLSATWRVEGQSLRGHFEPGRAYLRAAGEDFCCVSTAPRDMLFLSAEPPSLAWACDLLKVKGARMLRSHLVGERPDQKLVEMTLALNQCVTGETLNGSLYEESVLLAVSLQLVMLYRADGLDRGLPRAGVLPARKLDIVQDYVWTNLSRNITLDDIARCVHLSAYHLCRQFRNAMPLSLWQYVLYCRAVYARRLIDRHPDMPFAGIANASGFRSYSAFFNAFQKTHGITPSQLARLDERRL